MKIVFLDSAYKHSVTEYAITQCLINVRAEAILEEAPEKRLFIGFDHNGNPLEVIGIIDDEILTIIHAMKLRKQYFYLLEETSNESKL
jgi:hypothetical protein